MKATGIVRRIDDLGRVVIPKEIRRTMRIREGDPLEIYTSKEGEVIFKKYSLMGGVDEFAAQICETLNKTTGLTVAVTDRDSVVAAAGSARRDLIGKRISTELEQIMEDRAIYRAQGSERSVYVTDTLDRCCAAIAAPIISEGDALGLVLFVPGLQGLFQVAPDFGLTNLGEIVGLAIAPTVLIQLWKIFRDLRKKA